MLIQINVKMTEGLKEEIKKAAKRMGLTMSGYVRMVLLERLRIESYSRMNKGQK